MKSDNSKWLIFTAAACIGCCAIPLFTIAAGASGIGLIAALIDPENFDLLMCLLPLPIIFAGFLIYKGQQAKSSCCTSPKDECNKIRCANK